MIFRPNARAHSPFRAIEVGATNPEASETRHRATSTTNALKAMVKEVEFRREERREGSVNRWISEWIKLNIAGGSKLVPRIPPPSEKHQTWGGGEGSETYFIFRGCFFFVCVDEDRANVLTRGRRILKNLLRTCAPKLNSG